MHVIRLTKCTADKKYLSWIRIRWTVFAAHTHIENADILTCICDFKLRYGIMDVANEYKQHGILYTGKFGMEVLCKHI